MRLAARLAPCAGASASSMSRRSASSSCSGSDAAEFLERVYANRFASLPVGRARYGLMLREDGMVFDDGTVSRLGEHHYFITTTTAQAALVRRRLEHCRQVLWPDLDVELVAVADQWAAIAARRAQRRGRCWRGPRHRRRRRGLTLHGLRARAVSAASAFASSASASRVTSPTKSMCRLGAAQSVWQRLLDIGAPHEITPYGLDALNALRIEKGHVTHAEINGRTTAEDLGLGRMLKQKGDFIGKRSLHRQGLTRKDRWQLVGLASADARTPHPFGRKADRDDRRIYARSYSRRGDLDDDEPDAGAADRARASRGWALASWRDRHRESPRSSAAKFRWSVTSPVFFDPEGKQLRG